jgi:hypothetical protein
MCAVAVAIDRFSAFGATAQPANSSVKNATTVRLTAPPLSILFFMNPFICLIQPAQHRDYSIPSDKKDLVDQNPPGTNCAPASQDRTRMRIDCRTTTRHRYAINDSCTLYGARRFVIECPAPSTTVFLAMKNSIIFISALSLVAMMLASCKSVPSAFAPDETATTSETWHTNETPPEPSAEGSGNSISGGHY